MLFISPISSSNLLCKAHSPNQNPKHRRKTILTLFLLILEPVHISSKQKLRASSNEKCSEKELKVQNFNFPSNYQNLLFFIFHVISKKVLIPPLLKISYLLHSL